MIAIEINIMYLRQNYHSVHIQYEMDLVKDVINRQGKT